jgi:hypothetical protein
VNYRSAPAYTIIVERSNDLKYWIEVLRTEVEVGTTLLVDDTTPTGQQFYRTRGFLSD